jgi:two-component system sensor histidine kinase/response regulator
MPLPPTKSTPQEILVIDDTPDNLRLLSAILTRKNYEVRKALNSHQAIASVKADAPDLILLDIKMPEVNGYEICIRLKQDPTTQDIPIIFISALDDALDKVQAFAVGGVDYITKPFQEAEVLARIENQLKIQDLQRQLKAQNQELLRSNQELDQFAHIVSHDLQQPLQSIMGYAKILTMQSPELNQSPAKDHIDNILKAGDRMQRLVKNILNYAQLNENRDEFTEVSLEAVIDQVLSNLDQAIQTRNAHISYQNLPILLGDEVQLVQLFQNLISNAIKFILPQTSPVIEITATPQDSGQWLLAVKDNGIGIPPEHLSSVFDNFRRLHKTDDVYPGNGIGLAICKKIVEKHGGRIWVESQVGEGTTFYFYLSR